MKYDHKTETCIVAVLLAAASYHPVSAGTMGNISPNMNDWTGFYVGLNSGWGWSRFSSDEIPFGDSAVEDIIPQSLKSNTNGPLFGAQIGYNAQLNRIVLGIEADIDGAGIQGNDESTSTSLQSLDNVPDGSSVNGFTLSQNTNMLGSVRGRVGVEFNALNQFPGMAYFTGGYAWRQVSDVITASGNVVGEFSWSDVTSGHFTNTQSGYALGAGGEFQVAPHWSVRGEYLFYGFSKTRNHELIFPNAEVEGSGILAATKTHNINLVRFGVNYRL